MRLFPSTVAILLFLLHFFGLAEEAVAAVGNKNVSAEESVSPDELEARKARAQIGPKHLGNGLVELDESSIEEFIDVHPTTLVLFYAFWCHWCKDLLPKYREAARLLQAKGALVTLGQLDASRNLKAADKFDIRAYPTITLFLDGVAHEYEGGRTAREIVAWVEQHVETEPVIETAGQLDALLEASRAEPLVLAHLTDDDAHNCFHNVSRHVDHVQFGNIANDQLVDSLLAQKLLPPSVDRHNFILLINPHHRVSPETEMPSYVFPGLPRSEKELMSFIQRFLFPAVVSFTYDTAPLLLQDGRDLVVLFTDGQPAGEATVELSKAAAELRGRVLFAVAHQDPAAKRLQFAIGMNSADETFPTVCVIRQGVDAAQRQKFRMGEEQPLTGENIGAFVRDVLSGKAKPWMRSEERPEEPAAEGEVETLVALDWEKRVEQTTKDVLVKVYAPWCGHCKMLEPTYNEVADLLSSVPSVDVMRIDATRNEVPLPVSGYPTLLLVTGAPGDRKPKYYSGARTAESIVAWVAEEAGTAFDAARVLGRKSGGGGGRGGMAAVGVDEL